MMSDKFSGHLLLAEDCLEKECKSLLTKLWFPLPTRHTGQDCLDRQGFHFLPSAHVLLLSVVSGCVDS